ncbi:S8 family serine peptidase [Campylobacter sp. VTCC 70190]|uniref:S8 family serine peptidase n=1 Tax=Campylobacter sp. VTCC 70190 TaxID=3392118 RepID=UPI00398E720A
MKEKMINFIKKIKPLSKAAFFLVFSLEFCFANANFKLINLQDVHNEGFSGKGVVIGILDSPIKKDHPSLKDNFLGEALPVGYTPNFQQETHGTHVAGIAVGKFQNPSTPYGVAYDTHFYSLASTVSSGTPINTYDYFKDKSEVKIINNSWGYNYFPFQNKKIDQGVISDLVNNINQVEQFVLQIASSTKTPISSLTKLADERHVLSVFAAGNEGMLSAGLAPLYPYYNGDLPSWLVVGALDSANIKQNGSKWEVSSKGVADFSNAFQGSTLFSLMAPGYDISSANSADNGYTSKNGTSMAAPFVSGVAALVSEKYPFLDGKQIADVLLSTANNDFLVPKLTVKLTRLDTNTQLYTIVYIDSPVPNDEATLKKDLKDSGYSDAEINEFLAKPNTHQGTNGRISLSKEQVFGQGILDAKKAMQGLALIDINRLNDDSLLVYKNEAKAAYYTLDTQNTDAVFSNDINQRKWDDKYHLATAFNAPFELDSSFDAGFIKKGQSTLTLTGNLNYKAPTLVKEGHMKLVLKPDKSGGTITLSNVYVEKGAKLSGDGKIEKNLHNEGIVRPGKEDLSHLSVGGTYSQEGADSSLQLDFDTRGNSMLIASSYDIKSGKLEYLPLQGEFYPAKKPVTIELGGLKNSLHHFSSVGVLDSNSLDFVLDEDKLSINKLDIIPELKPNAYNTPNSTAGAVLRKIRSSANLTQAYENYFGFLDTANAKDYEAGIRSIDSNAYLHNNVEFINEQQKFVQNNLFSNLSSFKTASQPVLFASLLSDVPFDFYEEEKNHLFYLAPHFKKYNGKDYDGTLTGFEFGVANSLGSNSVLNLSANIARSKLEFSEADFKSNHFNLGANLNADLEYFRFLGGLALAYGKNDMQRRLYASTQSFDASYDNVVLSGGLGLAKDFSFYAFNIAPFYYFTHTLIHQGAFKENDGIFSKSYQKVNHNTNTLMLGVNTSYEYDFSQINALFAYERRLSGKVFKNKVAFKDFSDELFTQNYHLDKNLFLLSLAYSWEIRNYFFGFDLRQEFTNKDYNIGSKLSAGFKF